MRLRGAPDFSNNLAESHLDMGALLRQTGDLAEGCGDFDWRFNRGGETSHRPGYDAPV